jgi:hypothetical protein
MKGKNKIIISVLSCVIVFSCAVIYFLHSVTNGEGESLISGTEGTLNAVKGKQEVSSGYGTDLNSLLFPGMSSPDDFVSEVVSRLNHDFGPGPIDKTKQMQLMGLKQYLSNLYPDNHMTLFREIIKKAYPAQVDEILKTLDRLEAYNVWLEANKQSLGQMTHDDIKKALWTKRKAMFGEDAVGMWAEETRTEAIGDVLDIMRDSYDTNLNEKLNLYTQAISRISENSGASLMEDKKASLTRAFLSLDSVQAELSEMDQQKRNERLRDIRKAMGYSEPEMDTLAEKDAVNENKWQKGYAYMSERSRLLNEPDDGTRSEKLIALQDRFFKNAASTIQAEESSGFFRFNRPRVYGRN